MGNGKDDKNKKDKNGESIIDKTKGAVDVGKDAVTTGKGTVDTAKELIDVVKGILEQDGWKYVGLGEWKYIKGNLISKALPFDTNPPQLWVDSIPIIDCCENKEQKQKGISVSVKARVTDDTNTAYDSGVQDIQLSIIEATGDGGSITEDPIDNIHLDETHNGKEKKEGQKSDKEISSDKWVNLELKGCVPCYKVNKTNLLRILVTDGEGNKFQKTLPFNYDEELKKRCCKNAK